MLWSRARRAQRESEGPDLLEKKCPVCVCVGGGGGGANYWTTPRFSNEKAIWMNEKKKGEREITRGENELSVM